MQQGPLEDLLQLLLKGAYGQGQRFVKEKAVAAGIYAIQAIRRLILLQYALMIACFLFSASIFSTGWLILDPLGRGEAVSFTLPLRFSIALLVLTGAALFYSIREKTWVDAIGLERHINNLMHKTEPAAAQPMNREELAELIGEVLEKREEARRAKPASS